MRTLISLIGAMTYILVIIGCEIPNTIPPADNRIIYVESIVIDFETLNLIEGRTLQLSSTISPETATNKTIRWTSSDDTIATIDSNGLVTGVRPGTVTITIVSEDGNHQDSIEVTIWEYVPLTSIMIEQDGTVVEGKRDWIDIYVTPDDASDVEYTVSLDNENIVIDRIYSEYFSIVGETPGETNITVTMSENPLITETFTMTVIADTVSPTIYESFLIDQDTFFISFSESINPSALFDKNNYRIIQDPDGLAAEMAIHSITDNSYSQYSSSEIYVQLETPLNVGEYATLKIQGILDKAGNQMSEEEYRFGCPRFFNTVINTDYVRENNGRVKLDAGAVNMPTDSHYVPGSLVVVVFEEGDIPYHGYYETIATLQSDGSTSDFFPYDYELWTGDYDLYIYALYDIDGDFTTTEDQYPCLSDSVLYSVTKTVD